MKIAIQTANSAPHFVRSGWAKVFQALGHQTYMWYKEQMNCFDMFAQFKPDILITTTYDCDESVDRCIRKHPETKVAMFASAWGDLTGKLDKKRYPIVYVTEDEKKRLEKLKRDTGQPDFVFIHITDNYLEPCMGGWKELGIKPVGILNGADTFSYLNGNWNPEFVCDVGYIGGNWPYKGENIGRFLIPLCEQTDYRIKIFGGGNWGVPQHLGFINENNAKDLFTSATICPNVSEPHAYEFPDIVERVFKVPIANGFLISDRVDLSEVFDSDDVPQFDSLESLISIIEHFKKNIDDRFKCIKKQKQTIMKNHTYFHRVSQMLSEFGLESESLRCIMEYEHTYKDVLENL